MTFESTGRKKYKLLSVEETLVPIASVPSVLKNSAKNKPKSAAAIIPKTKRKNKTKITSDSEEDISLEDVDSKSSEPIEDDSDDVCDDDEEDEDDDEEEEEEEEEQLNPEEIEEDEDEDDEVVVNEEEIFEDEDEENPVTSDEEEEDE